MKPIYQYAAGFVLGVTLPLVVIYISRKPEPKPVHYFTDSGWRSLQLLGPVSVKAYRVTDNTLYCANYRKLFSQHKVNSPEPPPTRVIGNSRVLEGPISLDPHFASKLSDMLIDWNQFPDDDNVTQPMQPEMIFQWSVGDQNEEVDVSSSKGLALYFIYRDISHPTTFGEGTISPQFIQLAKEAFPDNTSSTQHYVLTKPHN
jgi:hypothetical protein